MQEFHLQGNGFTGTLPASLVEQQSLVSLRLDDTKLRWAARLLEGIISCCQLAVQFNSTLLHLTHIRMSMLLRWRFCFHLLNSTDVAG